MKRFLARLLLFFTVFPALMFVVFWDFQLHLVINILIVWASIVGAQEMAGILEIKGFPINRFLTPLFGALLPVFGYAEKAGWLEQGHFFTIIALLIIIVFSRHVFAYRTPSLESIVHKVTGNLAILIYPGLFSYFLVKISSFPQASLYLLVFLLVTLGNDAGAYVAGNLFGRKSKVLLRVSPNKSLAGFIGGLIISPVILCTAAYLRPDVFGSMVYAGVFGTAVGLATILGDLFESALKRSSGLKDSGTAIPGRGGMLDSIDSLLFAAPVYFLYLDQMKRLGM